MSNNEYALKSSLKTWKLVSGILSIVCTFIVMFGLAALVGFSGAGNYSDLNIWAGWCALNAVLAVVAMVKNGKKMNAQ